MTILKATDIGISFGGVKAIDGVSLSVAEGQIFSIIGPNGAGKTTLFNVISGLYRADKGNIVLSGNDVTGLAPEDLAARGLSRTFQNQQIFQRMTAAENVMVGRHLRDADVLAGSLSYGACKRLEIARALAAEPEVLLLDEPAAGCNAVETEEVEALIRKVATNTVISLRICSDCHR